MQVSIFITIQNENDAFVVYWDDFLKFIFNYLFIVKVLK